MNVFEPLGIHAAIDFVLLGVILYIAMYEVWLWRGVRGSRVHLVSVLWCLGTMTLIAGRIIQFATQSEPLADFVIRLQMVAVAPLFVVAIGAVRAMSGRPIKRFWVVVVVTTIAAAVVTFMTSLLVSDELYLATGLAGHRYLLLRAGTIAPALLIAGVLSVVYVLWTLSQISTMSGTTRRWWYVLAPICLIASANDVAILCEWYPTIHLFEFVIVGIAVALSHDEVRQYDSLYRTLEDRVVERTKEFEAAAHTAAENEARFRQLSEASREGVIVHERGTIIDVNSTLGEMFERDVASFDGIEITSLFDEDSRRKVLDVLEKSIEHPVELIGLRGSSDSELTGFPVEVARHEPGDETASVDIVVLRDLTEQKQMQAQLLLAERMASVGTLAAGTAHEINNPMTYVAANLQFIAEELGLLEEALDEETMARLRGLVDEAEEGCRRVRRIVQDLKTFSRDGAPQTGAVDVEAVFDATLRMASNEIRHRARLVRDIDDVPPVLADEGRIGQVILNLLVNAAQVLPEGHADENEIRFSAKRGENETVVIEVSDSGPGISAEDRETIFDPFFTTKPAGLGLGLSICRNIVTILGGTISVDEAPHGGALFRVELPAAQGATPQPSQISPPRRKSTTPSGTAGRARVLIVDDEVMVARALGRALATDHDVTMVWSGREALERCGGETFDVILCDLMMPDVTGMDVYESLSENNAEMAHRVVFVTGGAFTKKAQDFLRTVPNPHLEKPLDINALRALIDQVVEGETSS